MITESFLISAGGQTLNTAFTVKVTQQNIITAKWLVIICQSCQSLKDSLDSANLLKVRKINTHQHSRQEGRLSMKTTCKYFNMIKKLLNWKLSFLFMNFKTSGMLSRCIFGRCPMSCWHKINTLWEFPAWPNRSFHTMIIMDILFLTFSIWSKHKKKVRSVLVEFLSLIQWEESGRGAEEEQEGEAGRRSRMEEGGTGTSTSFALSKGGLQLTCGLHPHCLSEWKFTSFFNQVCHTVLLFSL